MILKDKKAIITGANRGFGLAVAKSFVQNGADVMLCARDESLLINVQKELMSLAKNNSRVFIMKADVSRQDNINALLTNAIEKMGGVDIVVSNAGVYGPKGPIDEIDWQEWSDAIDINLKGTVMLCSAAARHFKKQNYGKIILLSGGGATKPMPNLSAYAASKAAVVRFGETLAYELSQFNVDVNSIAPGALNTRLLEEVLAAGPEKVGEAFYKQSVVQKESGGTSLEVGASLCVYLASSKSDGITGKLISAVWDPWKTLNQYIDDLKNSDIYTLRRITPKDRGKDWGEVE